MMAESKNHNGHDSSWRIILFLVVGALVVAGAWSVRRNVGDAVEFLIYVVVLGAIWRHHAVLAYIGGLSRERRVVAALLISGLFLGQSLRSSASTFPFVEWNMYGEALGQEEIQYDRFFVELSSGELLPFEPTSLFPSLSHGRMSMQLRRLGRAATQPGAAENGRADAYSALLVSMVNQYERMHDRTDIQALVVKRTTEVPGQPDTHTTERVWREPKRN